MNKGYQGSSADYAKGGKGDPSVSRFLKTPDQFRTDTGVAQDYGSKGGNKPKDKSLTPVKAKS